MLKTLFGICKSVQLLQYILGYRVLKCDVTKIYLKSWDLAPFSNRASLKKVLAKNDLLIVIPSRNIKGESLILPHINLSNFESVLN